MEINLRRAAKLRSKLEARLNELRAEVRNTVISVNPLDTDIEERLTKAREEWQRAGGRLAALSEVLLSLRLAIAAKNADSYIADKIATIANLKLAREVTRQLAKAGPMLNAAQRQARIEAEKIRLNNGAYVNEVVFDFRVDGDIAAAKQSEREIDLTIEQLHMEVETQNAKLTISLDENHVALLQAEGLL